MAPHTYYCPGSCEICFFHFSGAQATQMVRLLIAQHGSCCIRSDKTAFILPRIRAALDALSAGESVSTGQLSRMAYSMLSHLQDFDLPLASEPGLQHRAPTWSARPCTRSASA